MAETMTESCTETEINGETFVVFAGLAIPDLVSFIRETRRSRMAEQSSKMLFFQCQLGVPRGVCITDKADVQGNTMPHLSGPGAEDVADVELALWYDVINPL